MEKQRHREFLLLQEMEQNPIVTQRSLSKKLGVALGLTNLYLKRLTRKGYIKISTLPKNRIRYLLTPHGIAEKSRLTYEYIQVSLNHYRDVRKRLNHIIAELEQLSLKRIVIFGVGELAEFAYLSIKESEITLVGFVADEPGDTFLSLPRGSLEVLKDWEFDAILITDLTNIDRTKARLLHAHISREQVFSVV